MRRTRVFMAVFLAMAVVSIVSGCTFMQSVVVGDADGFEVHTLKNVTVIYGSRDAIIKKYKELGGTKENIWGFAIPPLNIIYCVKGDFVTCGHELEHLTDGYFHD